MTKVYRCEQSSAEWYGLRRGKPTTSNFHKIITPTGKPSAQARGYLYRLVAERLLSETLDDPLHIEWVERGKELEPHAIAQFQFHHEVELERVGFITNDAGTLGFSPDALIKGRNEAVEIKVPAPWTQIGYLLDGPGNDYRPQVQGQLLVGELDAVHFYAYHDRMPAVHNVTHPDQNYGDLLKQLLSDFLEQLEEATEKARSLGAYAAAVNFTTPFDEQAPPPEPLTIIVP